VRQDQTIKCCTKKECGECKLISYPMDHATEMLYVRLGQSIVVPVGGATVRSSLLTAKDVSGEFVRLSDPCNGHVQVFWKL
jgi:hypothetical protein